MKAATTFMIIAWSLALLGACSSTSREQRSSLDAQQQRIERERSGLAQERPGDRNPSVGGPTANDFDQDRDGVPDADEVAVGDEAPRGEGMLTPIDQSNTSSDLEITQQIRKQVIDDDALSFNAKNVKIITVGGKVTLRGPVESFEERTAVERAARAVPGVARVDNQLEVKR